MTIVIIHCGFPTGPRKEYQFPLLRMATTPGDGFIADARITKGVSHGSWVGKVIELAFFSRVPAE